MPNVIIVDDEPLALDVLETYIEKIPELTLVQKCTNAIEANAALQNHSIDIMFLDIQMPQLTGIEFLKTLKDPPLVIFTTAYANYAIEGFELEATDYLLKPISFDRFLKSVNRAVDLLKLKEAPKAEIEAPAGSDHIFVKADKKLIKITYDEIQYIEGLKDYVIIRMSNDRVITLQTMKSLEVKLPSNIFHRIHRSYIVNLTNIKAIVGNMVEVKEKGQVKHIPIGKNYRDQLLKIVQEKKL